MKKISVEMCIGTTCFVKDSANMQELNKIIPQKYGDKVEIIASNCLGLCSINWQNSKAPYVKVNGEVISEATVEKILKEIDRQLKK